VTEPVPVALSSFAQKRTMGTARWINAVGWSHRPDGRLLLAIGGNSPYSAAPAIQVWDYGSGELVWSKTGADGLSGNVNDLAWGEQADGRPLLITTVSRGQTQFWDPDADALLHTLPWETTVSPSNSTPTASTAWARMPDGSSLIAASAGTTSNAAWIVDPATGQVLQTLTGHIGGVFCVAWGYEPDGRPLLATAGADKIVRIWDPATGENVQALTSHGTLISAIAWGRQANGEPVLATVGADATVLTWERPGGDLFTATAVPQGIPSPRSVAWVSTGDGRLLLATSGGTELGLWDGHSLQFLGSWQLGSPTGGYHHLNGTVTSDGRLLLAVGSQNDSACVWEAVLDPLVQPPPPRGGTTSLPDGTARHLGLPAQLVLPPQEVTLSFTGAADIGEATHSVACHVMGDGRILLATGGAGPEVHIWDLDDRRHVRTLTGHSTNVLAVEWAQLPDGRLLLATGSEDQTARVWDVSTGECLRTFTGHTDGVFSVAWAEQSDGRLLLATGSGVSDRSARTWDPETGRCLRSFTGSNSVMWSVAPWPAFDGQAVLATGGRNPRIWDLSTGSVLRELAAPGSVTTVAWAQAPDGRLLLATSGGNDDHTARIWDANTGECLRVLTGHTASLYSATWAQAPDGRLLLATSSTDGTARIWDTETGDELASMEAWRGPTWNSLAWIHDRSGALLLLIANHDRAGGPVRAWRVATAAEPAAAETPAGNSATPAALTAQAARALLRLGTAGLWRPLGLLADLIALTGPEGITQEPFPLNDPRLAALAGEAGVARLRDLAAREPRWPPRARAAFAAMLARDLDVPAQFGPPVEAEPAELRAALSDALSAAPPTGPGGRAPGTWRAEAADVRAAAADVTDQAVTLLAILGPDACAADPLLPVRLASHVPWLPALSPRELRLLTGGGPQRPAAGVSSGLATLVYSPGTAGVARNGPLTRLLPSQLALPHDVLTTRLAEDQLLFRQHRAPVPPAPEPVTIILDTTPPTFGPAGNALRLAAHLIATTLWEHGRHPLLVTLTDPATVTEARTPADLVRIWTSATLNDPLPCLSAALATASGTGLPAVLLTHHHTAREKYSPGPATRLLTSHQPPEEPPSASSSPWHRHLPPGPTSGQLAAAITALLTPDHHNGNRP
jgi:WD40 repeat protein